MRILALLTRFPHPLDKGDKLRARHQLAELSRRHQVTLVALSHQPVDESAREALRAHCDRVEVLRIGPVEAALGLAWALLSGRPLQVGYFTSRRARQALARIVAQARPERAFVQLARGAEYAGVLGVPVTLDLMDAFAWGLDRRAALQPGALGPLLRLEARRLRRYEAGLLDRFARVTIISEQDRDRIAHPHRDRLRVIGNGVDLETFQPRPVTPDHDLLFVGNMAYPPNVLAAERLVREVLPRVRAERPCRVLIAGTTPSARVRQLAGDGVTVTGWVDDMAGCYARSRVFVAPLALGTGLQNKLLQALAMELPCVTTPIARAALGAGDAEVAVGRDGAELAAHALALLGDPRRARELGRSGRRFALARFRWPDAVAPLEALITS